MPLSGAANAKMNNCFVECEVLSCFNWRSAVAGEMRSTEVEEVRIGYEGLSHVTFKRTTEDVVYANLAHTLDSIQINMDEQFEYPSLIILT